MNFHHKILRQAIAVEFVTPELTAIGVMDIEGLEMTVNKLPDAFPANFKHTFAVKANGLLAVLKKHERSGMGAEVTSREN